jgi:hypothetical protein
VIVLRRFWPSTVALFGAVVLARIEYGTLPESSFYEMAAQVIPILIVALAVENRAHAFWGRISNVYNVQVVVFLAVGELSAIVAASGVIAEGDALVGPTVGISQAMLGATVAGLVAGFVSVLVLALRGATSGEREISR